MISSTKFSHVNQVILYVLTYDEGLITLALLWKQLRHLQCYKNLTKEKQFFEGWCWLTFNDLRLVLGLVLNFYSRMAKESKLKAKKFWVLLSTF